ncbi:MotE family protein [Telmatospirillum sp. J64-1]|uniref:MotE family protein n=1 Tax=Telmatospirillum sp. J64-1 TaxID=2502183 RepID=UPI00115C7AAB|nr:hypothetical protein [Telmatospirillum sp. J64-1]
MTTRTPPQTSARPQAPAQPVPQAPSRKDRRMFSLRLLPLVIFMAALMLSVRVKDIWQGVLTIDFGGVTATQVEAKAPAPLQVSGGLVSAARAQAADQAAPTAAAAEPGGIDPAMPPGVPPPGEFGEPAFSPNELDVLQRLSERREGLDARSRELDMREGLLKAAEERIDRKISELKTLQDSIDSLLRKHDEQEEEKMRSLVRIYENMKPKEAARIFEELDMPILLDVVERMKEQRVAPILASMEPSKARALTAEMAMRRQLPVADVNG